MYRTPLIPLIVVDRTDAVVLVKIIGRVIRGSALDHGAAVARIVVIERGVVAEGVAWCGCLRRRIGTRRPCRPRTQLW